MNIEYFLVRIFYDRNGNVIKESAEVIKHITNPELIFSAEYDNTITQKIKNKSFPIIEAAKLRKLKNIRPTVPNLKKIE